MIKKQDAEKNGFKTVQRNCNLSQHKNEKLQTLKKLIPNLVNSDNQINTTALQDFVDDCSRDKKSFVSTSNNKGYELTFAGKGIARAKADSETEFELQFEPKQSKIPHQVRNDQNATVIAGDDPQSQPDTQGHCGLDPQSQPHTQGHCGLDPQSQPHTQGHCGLDPQSQPHTQGHCGLDPQSQNTVIRGDNLEVLKILKQNYFEKIKMIYIDPPYNTKSENFIYQDNFKQSEEELIENFGLDENTTDFLQNVYGTRSHSGWLAFMYPRLKLARDLLKEDGVIFISIDDNEQANLKIICDEIFGEENFLGQIVAQTNPRGRQLDKFLAKTFEYILVFSKNINEAKILEIPKSEKTMKEYNMKDEIGNYRLLELRNRGSSQFNRITRPNLYFPIYINPETRDISLEKTEKFSETALPLNSKKEDGCWTWSKDKIVKDFNFLTAKKTKDGIWRVFRKDYIPKGGATSKEKTLWIEKNINHENGKELVSTLLKSGVFDFPKSTEIIKKCLRIGAKPNDLILDFFAGSGTTGDAVMQLNAEDISAGSMQVGKQRKFILVQWDEKIDKKKNAEAYKFCRENNFEPVISSITIERLNQAGERLRNKSAMTRKGDSTQPKSHSEPKSHSALDAESLFKDEMADQVRHEDKQKVIAGNDPQSQPHAQSHCGLDPQSQLDIGYKVFSLTKKPKLAEQDGLFRLINERKTTADTLYNMLCATGKPLHTSFKELIADKLYLVETTTPNPSLKGGEFQGEVSNSLKGGEQGEVDNGKFLYVLGEISLDKWETVGTNPCVCPIDECQIYIDGYSDISLENWLNLFGLNEKDNEWVAVVY